MEFGWYHEFHRQVEGQSDADAFAQGFEQVEAADRWGLDVFWLAEIHQQARRSVLSAPMNVAGQIAARTKRIKIGTAVHVLPLAHPLRLAEETATVDVVSRGRFILGAGRSGNPRGYAAYGVPYAESRERFYETLEILKKAWTEDTFSYDGQYHSFNEARAVPRPYQRPHPPIRIAGASEDTFPTLGRLGYPLFVSVRSGSLMGLKPDLKAYRAAYAEAGHPGHGEVYLDDRSAARRRRRSGPGAGADPGRCRRATGRRRPGLHRHLFRGRPAVGEPDRRAVAAIRGRDPQGGRQHRLPGAAGDRAAR